jgi:ribosomal protein S18 acetylase RimI-like enzyme
MVAWCVWRTYGLAMEVVVAKTPQGWMALHSEVAIGKAAAMVRPDARCFVSFDACRADAYQPLVQAMGQDLRRDLYTEIGEADIQLGDRLVGLGFVVNRREHLYVVPTDPTVTALTNVAVPAGFEIRTADQVDEDRLRGFDEELKQDVPGADDWTWDRQGFRNETYGAPDFDPATYLVAIERPGGRYAGLVRVWNRPSGPRLGLIAVGRPYRRRGLARSLLARVFGVLHQRGETEVVAEVDTTNTGANRLLISLGARRAGGSIELIRPWSAASSA